MSWMLVSDSTCEIHHIDDLAPDTQFATVPLKIRVGDREFVDNAALNVPQMMEVFANFNGPSSTACPSPEEWAEKFLMADQSIALTITHTLSGSYNSACAARDMVLEEHPEKKIFVLDSLSCGGEIAMILWHLNDLIKQGLSFEEVCRGGQAYADECHLMFALASFENLVRNGRISRVVGFVAGKLNMRILGRASQDGRLEMFFKTRGETKVLARILEEMDQTGFHGQHPVMISHNNNEQGAQLLRHGILARWPEAQVHVYPCGGLCAYYEQVQGIIIGY